MVTFQQFDRLALEMPLILAPAALVWATFERAYTCPGLGVLRLRARALTAPVCRPCAFHLVRLQYHGVPRAPQLQGQEGAAESIA